MSISIAVPAADQQEKIIESTDALTREIGRSIAAARREIDLLQEFRTRLIADVVTGKLDVRDAARRLPETFETEAVDEGIDDEDLDGTVDDEAEEIAA